MNDCVTNETIYSGGTSGTLDLGGHTYTYTVSTAGHQIVQINYDNVAFTIENGVVTASEAGPDGITNTYSGSSVVLDGVTVNVAGSGYGIVTNGGQENNAVVLRNSTLNVPLTDRVSTSLPPVRCRLRIPLSQRSTAVFRCAPEI